MQGEEEEEEEEKARYLRGRRLSMIYENKSIETRSLCVVMLLIRWEEEEEEGGRKKKKKMAMFITCLNGSSLRKVQISSANAFDDNDIL